MYLYDCTIFLFALGDSHDLLKQNYDFHKIYFGRVFSSTCFSNDVYHLFTVSCCFYFCTSELQFDVDRCSFSYFLGLDGMQNRLFRPIFPVSQSIQMIKSQIAQQESKFVHLLLFLHLIFLH